MKVITEQTEMNKYIWKGLDTARYKPLALVLHTGEPIILMHEKDTVSPTPWCAQYRGNGRYFKTLAELDAYCDKRWSFSAEKILSETAAPILSCSSEAYRQFESLNIRPLNDR